MIESASDGLEYTIAHHGYGRGLSEMVNLCDLEGFDGIRTIGEVARFAHKIQDSVGFTAHPEFESGTRYAHAVIWYTTLSPTNESWPLYLFDREESQKLPGEPAQPTAIAAGNAKVAGMLTEARNLVISAQQSGVRVPELKFDDKKILALAIIQIGGSFQHSGEYSTTNCWSCRSVVPDGDPEHCGLGIKGTAHWNCCGAIQETGACQYWERIKAQDDEYQSKNNGAH